MHSALLLVPTLIFLIALVFAVPVLLRLLRPCSVSSLTPEWLDEFKTSNYSAMQGLLAPEDFDFVARQPGFDPAIRRKLRRDRLLIFRHYLDRLILDFKRLHRFAIVMVSQTDEDRSELLVRLLKLRVRFSISVIRVEFAYLLCRFGMRWMPVGDLLAQLDAMSTQLATLPKARQLAVNL